jgi:hypothetical protein
MSTIRVRLIIVLPRLAASADFQRLSGSRQALSSHTDSGGLTDKDSVFLKTEVK